MKIEKMQTIQINLYALIIFPLVLEQRIRIMRSGLCFRKQYQIKRKALILAEIRRGELDNIVYYL